MRRAVVAVLAVALIRCGSGSATEPDTLSPRRAYAASRVAAYSAQVGVETVTEFSAQTFQVWTAAGFVPAAAYGSFQSKAPHPITFWTGCVDDAAVCSESYLDALAAHEVCHVYYRDYLVPAADEARATECGARLQSGQPPL